MRSIPNLSAGFVICNSSQCVFLARVQLLQTHIGRVCTVACLSVWPLGRAPATLALTLGAGEAALPNRGMEPTLQIPMATDKQQQQQQQILQWGCYLLLPCIFPPASFVFNQLGELQIPPVALLLPL